MTMTTPDPHAPAQHDGTAAPGLALSDVLAIIDHEQDAWMNTCTDEIRFDIWDALQATKRRVQAAAIVATFAGACRAAGKAAHQRWCDYTEEAAQSLQLAYDIQKDEASHQEWLADRKAAPIAEPTGAPWHCLKCGSTKHTDVITSWGIMRNCDDCPYVQGIRDSYSQPTPATPPPAVPVPGAVFAVSDDDHYRDMHCAECGCTRRHFNIKGSSQWCCSMCKHLQTFPPLADQAEPKRVVLPFIVGQRVADISRSKRGIVTYVASGWLEYQDILTGETFAVENEYVSR